MTTNNQCMTLLLNSPSTTQAINTFLVTPSNGYWTAMSNAIGLEITTIKSVIGSPANNIGIAILTADGVTAYASLEGLNNTYPKFTTNQILSNNLIFVGRTSYQTASLSTAGTGAEQIWTAIRRDNILTTVSRIGPMNSALGYIVIGLLTSDQ